MQELRHPITLDTYGLDPETGLVVVTDTKDRRGIFTMTGEWCAGDKIDVDPLMCVWVGGPNPEAATATNFRQM